MLLSVSYEEVVDIEVNTLFKMLIDTLMETGKLEEVKEGSVIKSNGIESVVKAFEVNTKVILEMTYKGDLYQQHYYYTKQDDKTLLKYEEYYYSSSAFRMLNFKLYRLISKRSKLKRVKQMFDSLKLESR